MATNKPKVVLVENIHATAVAQLEAAGFVVEHHKEALPEAELLARVKDAVMLGIRSNTKLEASFFAAAPHLLAVGTFGIGTNQIDLAAASGQGVAVFNAPFSSTRSVVELVLADIIALNRRLGDKNIQMHAGTWDKSAGGSHEIRGQKLGIIGYGNVGSQLSIAAEALGMEVYYFDMADKLALGNARKCESMQELLETVDVVSVHIDGGAANRRLFQAAEFARMRKGAKFINVSRGSLVDAEALAEAISSGHLGGAAVDVYDAEPAGKTTDFVSPLQGVSNVILTPHIGGSTEEAQASIGAFVARKLSDYVTHGKTSLSVNLPELNVPALTAKSRLIYVHRNAPGALADVTAALAGRKANITAQQLNTRGELGYAVIDTDKALSKEDIAAIGKLPAVVRCRLAGGAK